MSRVSSRQVVFSGKIIDNYLVNFPQYIINEQNSFYKLEISDGMNVTSLRVQTTKGDSTCTLYIEHGGDVTIDWGDGTVNVITDKNEREITKSYPDTDGIYYIHIYGEYQTFRWKNGPVTQLQKLGSMVLDISSAFINCTTLKYLPYDILGQRVRNYDNAFTGCTRLTNIPQRCSLSIDCQSTSGMFSGCVNLVNIFNKNFAIPPYCVNSKNMFSDTGISTIPQNFFEYDYNIENIDGIFSGCVNLEDVNGFNINEATKLQSLDNIFNGCVNINNVNNLLITDNITSMNGTFNNCINLQSVSNIRLNGNITGLVQTFSNCQSLKGDIGDIIVQQFNKDVKLLSTFNNCYNIEGMIPVKYTFKSDVEFNNTPSNVFNHCSGVLNRTWLSTDLWGKYTEDTLQSNVFGCYDINMFDIVNNSCYYIVPIHRYLTDGTFNNAKFNINYGDDDIWHTVQIDSQAMDLLFINNENSVFNGCCSNISVYYKNAESDNVIYNQQLQQYAYSPLLQRTVEQQKQYVQQFVYTHRYPFLMQKLIHKYQKAGVYTITISGTVGRLYVSQRDFITNKFIQEVTTVQNIIGNNSSINHWFTNSTNLKKLPNQLVTGDISYAFYLGRGYTNQVTQIPYNFNLNDVTIGDFGFHNTFSRSVIPFTSKLQCSSNITSANYMFANNSKLSGNYPGNISNRSLKTLIDVNIKGKPATGIFYNCPLINGLSSDSDYTKPPPGTSTPGGDQTIDIYDIDFGTLAGYWDKIK